jgi:high affinity Mn2+ porin
MRGKLFVAAVSLIAITWQPSIADGVGSIPARNTERVVSDPWFGFYVGGYVGYGIGSLGSVTHPVLDEGEFLPSTVTGLLGGYQAGYNFRLPNNLILGFETDVSFTSAIDQSATGNAPFHTRLDYLATTRGRVGYVVDHRFLPYVTGGLAWGQTDALMDAPSDTSSRSATHLGWIVGAGVEFALGGPWTAKAEYDFARLGDVTYSAPPGLVVAPEVHTFKLGMNYSLDETTAASSSSIVLPRPDAGWNIHGQSTFIEQAYPSFRSPYEGPKSLPGRGEARETWTSTAFLGVRLWEGGELYFNPELDQGFGLGGTQGLAGFPNGEAQKAGADFPKFRPQRYFFRETFGLGGEQETVEDGPNQLAGKRDIDRLTVTVGRLAVGDIFDNNTYAHDPRTDFQNWALWASAAYDFPADLPGFTRGIVVELNRKDWALRGGLFQVPKEPNSDVLVFKTGGVIVELEERYKIYNQPGKLRLGVFANEGRTGNYDDALAIAAANPPIDINTAMEETRRQRPKYGFYVNAEQALTKDIGLFGRASWNDGQNEILSFTDVDASLSGGVSLKGMRWGRPDDTVGVGGALNFLSEPHRAFLAGGGLGLLIGDGALTYSGEKIVETYYAYTLGKGMTLTGDYQFFLHPAFNMDRGPVSIFSGRLHVEF